MKNVADATENPPLESARSAHRRLGSRPFSEIERKIQEASRLINSAADIAADLKALGALGRENWATAWRHIAALVVVPEGIKIAAAIEGEVVDGDEEVPDE